MEKIELCYDASPDLEWIATEESRKFVDIYQKLQKIDSLSVRTYLHEWIYSSELIFYIQGDGKSLELGLRLLYRDGGIPSAIAKTFVQSPSSKKAISISEKLIQEIAPAYDTKNIYVRSCSTRHKKAA